VKSWISAFLALMILVAPAPAAAHYVCLYGSYYKERSTRVISPMIEAKADLPLNADLQLGYLIDQITSASAAVTPGQDIVFQEYRHELNLAAGIELFGDSDVSFTPRIGLRYSDEPDYKSIGFNVDLELEILGQTTVNLGLGYLNDTVGMRPAPNETIDPNATRFRERLRTPVVRTGVTHVLTPSLIASIQLEAQLPRGFQENQYRVEQHPDERNRYSVSAWAAYRIEESRTTIRADYRFYADTWKMRAHSAELRITQRIVPSLEIEPRFRMHFQNGVFFIDAVTVDGETFRTEDPKLKAFTAQTFGLQISWELDLLEGTFLDLFADLLIQPYYAYLRQTNSYGDAHIAQLGALWPF
jgi:hypothetical protein